MAYNRNSFLYLASATYIVISQDTHSQTCLKRGTGSYQQADGRGWTCSHSSSDEVVLLNFGVPRVPIPFTLTPAARNHDLTRDLHRCGWFRGCLVLGSSKHDYRCCLKPPDMSTPDKSIPWLFQWGPSIEWWQLKQLSCGDPKFWMSTRVSIYLPAEQ